MMVRTPIKCLADKKPSAAITSLEALPFAYSISKLKISMVSCVYGADVLLLTFVGDSFKLSMFNRLIGLEYSTRILSSRGSGA